MYITYKITNKITGEYYIGSHKTDNLNDDYMGSGRLIKQSIKKYGVEAHEKEIIQIFDNREDSINLEHKLIKQKKSDILCINMSTGGFSFDYINNNMKFDRVAFGKLASHDYATMAREKSMEQYYKNPKKCLNCGNIIEYDKKTTNKFCSSSCAATYNNEIRNIKNQTIYYCCKCGKRLKEPKRKDGTAMCRQCYINEAPNIKRHKEPTKLQIILLEEKDKIREMHEAGVSYRKIGKEYNVSGNYIKELLKGRIRID